MSRPVKVSAKVIRPDEKRMAKVKVEGLWMKVTRMVRLVDAFPGQVDSLAAIDESGYFVGAIALKDLSRAQLPRNKEHILEFNLQFGRRFPLAAPYQMVAIT